MNNKKTIILATFIILSIYFVNADNTDLSSNSPSDEWWMLGKDTGYTRYTTANAPANISNTQVNSLAFPSDVTGAPIIVDESLFIHPYNYNTAYLYELNALNISQITSNSSGTYSLDGRSLTYYNEFLFMHSNAYLYQINSSNLSQTIDTETIGDFGYYATPTVSNNSVYVGTGNSNPDIDQFNATNISQVISTFNSPSRIYVSTPVLNEIAYGASSGAIYQLNISNLGNTIASTTCYANSIEFTFPVSKDYLYKKCTNGDGSNLRLTQINATDVTHHIANFSAGGWDYSLGNGYLYFVSGTTVYQLNASNITQQIANYTIPTSSTNAPVATPSYLFVSAGSVMYQLDASNISMFIGSYTAGGLITGPPVVAKGFLYFGSNDNNLYQLGTHNPLSAITIKYPINGSIHLNVTELNYTAAGNLAGNSCWNSNDNGETNSTPVNAGTNFTGLNSTVGWNNWTVYCNDSANLIFSDFTTFAIDNANPTFNSIENQTIQYSTALEYQLNATDDFDLSCYKVNDTTNFKINCSGYLENNTLLATELYWLNITINDSVNQINSATMFVNVTPISAIDLILISPTTNINVSQNEFFNVTINVSCNNADCGAINVTLDPSVDLTPKTCSGVWGASCEGSDPTTSDYSYDSCSAGSYYSSGFWVDEVHVNASIIALGDNLNITCDFDCYSSSSLNDIAIMYYNGTWNKIWRQDSACTDGNYSVAVKITGDVGQQYARCSIGYNLYPNDDDNDTCFDTTYSDNDDVNFTVIESSKNGVISTNISATPFYTNVTNPYNLSLNKDESAIITWWVNATGSIGDTFEFFVYVNQTSNEKISNITAVWNVSIKDLTFPIINITYPQNTVYGVDVNELKYTYIDDNPGSCWHSTNNGTTNSSTNTAGVNFTSLTSSVGSNTWHVYCNDSSGNENSTFVTFTKNLSDVSIQWIYPTSNINVSEKLFFNITVNVSCINTNCGEINVTLDPIQGTGSNYTAYNDSEALGDTFDWSEIIGNGGYALWDTGQSADDSYKTANLPFNFSFYGTNYSTVYVSSNGRVHFTTTNAGSTSLTVPSSSYKMVSPVNKDMYVRSATQVYLKNATNPNRAIIQYTNLDYYSGGPVSFTFQVILHEDGKINILYNNSNSAYSESSNTGLNQNSSDYLFLGTDAPDQYKDMAVTFLPPGYSTTSAKGGIISTNSNSTPFYTNVTNPYNLTLNAGESQLITWWVNATGTSGTPYSFFVYANITDDQSIGNITTTLNITIQDSESPIVNITYPQNTTYTTYVTSINYTYTDSNQGNCWFSVNNGTTNSSTVSAGINWTGLTGNSSIGSNTWNVYCNDSSANINSSSITFVVDIPPSISITSPTNNSFTSNSEINVLYTVSDTNLNSCWYSNDTYSSNTSLTCGTNITTVTWLEGNHNLTIWVNDTFGNVNSSRITFTIDTVTPSINITSPINNTNSSNNQLNIHQTLHYLVVQILQQLPG
jgi:hypothetical protein